MRKDVKEGITLDLLMHPEGTTVQFEYKLP